MQWLLQTQYPTGSSEIVSVPLTWKHVKNAQLQTLEVASLQNSRCDHYLLGAWN